MSTRRWTLLSFESQPEGEQYGKHQIEIRIGKEIKATACKQRDRLLRNGAIVTVGVPSGRVLNCFSLYLLGSGGTGIERYWLEDV